MADIIAHSGLPRRRDVGGRVAIMERGEGARVFDTEGRDYIDFVLGYGCVVVGHAPPTFQRRVVELMTNGLHFPSYSKWHYDLLAGVLAHARRKWTAAIFKTGSESVTAALRLAAAATGKRGVIRCGFLGWHDAAIASTPRWHEPLHSPLRADLRYVDGFRGVSGADQVHNWISLDLADLERMIRANATHIGALLIDSYQALFCGYDRLEAAIAIAHRHGLIVVFDETKTGGRVGPVGYADARNWDVDISIIGKSLANGAPLSILLGRDDLMAKSEALRITGTFSQEVSAIYCAIATLEEMERRDGYATLRGIGQNVVATFNAAIRDADAAGLVRASPCFDGAMFDLYFSDAVIGNWAKRQALVDHMTEQGVLLLQGHASYVSLAHALVDHADLHARLTLAFHNWRSA